MYCHRANGFVFLTADWQRPSVYQPDKLKDILFHLHDIKSRVQDRRGRIDIQEFFKVVVSTRTHGAVMSAPEINGYPDLLPDDLAPEERVREVSMYS